MDTREGSSTHQTLPEITSVNRKGEKKKPEWNIRRFAFII